MPLQALVKEIRGYGDNAEVDLDYTGARGNITIPIAELNRITRNPHIEDDRGPDKQKAA